MLKHSVMLLFLPLRTISLQMDCCSILLHYFITYGLLLYSAVSALFPKNCLHCSILLHLGRCSILLCQHHFTIQLHSLKNCLWCSIPQSLCTISLHLSCCSISLQWLYKSVSFIHNPQAVSCKTQKAVKKQKKHTTKCPCTIVFAAPFHSIYTISTNCL